MKPSPDYMFYPSLLDAFQRYIDLDVENYFFLDEHGKWHKNLNDQTGELFLSESEVERLAKAELLAMINREEGVVSEAADKGTAFNEIVDCIIMNKPCKRDDIQIRSQDFYEKGGDIIESPCIRADIDGFTFYFEKKFCKDAANYFRGSLCQQRTEGFLDTKYGNVLLYGYIDYLREDKVYDAKTTKRYEFGKFQKSWQKHVYPYTLIESGKCTDISTFEYSVFLLNGGTDYKPIIGGTLYPEVYVYNHDESKKMLKGICEHLIEFLNENKDKITDTKIFGK